MRQNPIEYFRLKSSESNSRISVGNMNRAIDSLSRFVAGTELSFSGFDADFLGEWIGRQFYEGYYAKTVAYNVSKIAALYNKAVEDGLATANDAFTAMLGRINAVGSKYDGINHSDTFQNLQAIYRTDYSTNPNHQLAKDIILFGVFNGGMTLEQIVAYKKDEYSGNNIHIQRIVEKYSRPKNKYLFPLRQAHSTPKRLLKSVKMLLSLFPKLTSTHLAKMPSNVLVDVWSDVAMNCGASSSEIACCISSTDVTNALTFCASHKEISSERVSQIRNQVIEVITDNPLHWYAMHLRQQSDFKSLTTRLKEKSIVLDEIFYPMEEIIHKVGKKMVFENRPVISWLIFYRTRVTQLDRLFQEIGDLAWGYRYLKDVKSPYAVVPDHEVQEYQQAIGTLSPSTQIISDEEVKFKEGDYIVVLGGSLSGLHGIFLSEKKKKGEASGRMVFRISLVGGNNVNWEVNCDPRLVKKISEGQYRELDGKLQENLKTGQ